MTAREALREMRTRAGKTLAQLAAELGIHEATLSDRERQTSKSGQDVTSRVFEATAAATGQAMVVTPHGWFPWEGTAFFYPYRGKLPQGGDLDLQQTASFIDLDGLVPDHWSPTCYLLQAADDQWAPLVRQGDWLVVEPALTPRLHQLVVMSLSQRSALYRMTPDPETGALGLAPIWDQFPFLELQEFTPHDCRGVVVGKLGRYVSFL